MFKKFKPKGLQRIDAVQITTDTVVYLSGLFMGRLTEEQVNLAESAVSPFPEPQMKVTGFEYPTFEGIKWAVLGEWVIRLDNGGHQVMSDKEFQETFEPAYTTSRS